MQGGETAPVYRSTYKPGDPTTDMVVAEGLLGTLSQESVRGDVARRDLGALHRVLVQGYAGFGRSGGRVAWDRAFLAMDAALPADAGTISTRDLIELLRAHLGPVAVDGALRVEGQFQGEVLAMRLGQRPELKLGDLTFERIGDRLQLHPFSAPAADMASAPISSCGDVQALPETFPVWEGQVGGVVQRFGWFDEAPAALLCTVTLENGVTRKLAVKAGPSAMATAEARPVEGVQVIEGAVPVVRVSTFDPIGARGIERLQKVLEPLATAPAVVVDLRGTSGEGRETASWLSQSLSGTAASPLKIRTLTTSMTAQGRLNLARRRVFEFEAKHPPDQPGRDEALERELHLRLGEARVALREESSEEPIWQEGQGVLVAAPALTLSGQVVVLIDRGCRALCEEVAATVAPSPRVTVVGENSAGETGFDEPLLYRLPGSLLWVHVPSRIWTDANGASAAGTGVLPEIWIDDGDPLEVARAIAQQPGPR